jgi:hypothetical protein
MPKKKQTKKKKEKSDKPDTIKKKIEKNQKKWLESYKKRWTITATCKEIGINRDTYYEWLKKYPDFKEKVEGEGKTQEDYVETMLVQLINNLNIGAIIFWLKHRHPAYKINQFKFKEESKSKLELTDEQFDQLLEEIIKERQKQSVSQKN